MFQLVNKIEGSQPDMLGKPIEKWDNMYFRRVQPFIIKHFWQDSTSINIFRVIGTQHPDYTGMTWIEFLKKGKRMSINLPLFKENPVYYTDTVKKMPSMYYLSIDGNDLYVGEDGNHRTCIAKAYFYLTGQTMLHGVTVDDYRIDWRLKEAYTRLIDVTENKLLPYRIEVVSETVSRDDSAGWMVETYKPGIKIQDLKNRKEVYLADAAEAIAFAGSLEKKGKPGFLSKLRFF